MFKKFLQGSLLSAILVVLGLGFMGNASDFSLDPQGTSTWHILPQDTHDKNADTFVGSYVYPADFDETWYMSFGNVPTTLFGMKVCVDQVTIFYTTLEKQDHFDFALQRDNHGGGTNYELKLDDIGVSEYGNNYVEIIDEGSRYRDSFCMHPDRGYQMKFKAHNDGYDVNSGGIRVYDIEVKGHLETI